MTTLKEAIYESEKERTKKLTTLEKDHRIIQANKQAIKDFLHQKQAEGISTQRQCIILQHLTRLARLTKTPFKQFTEQDLRNLLAALEASPKKYSDWTKNTSRILIKSVLRMYGWKSEQLEWVKNRRPANTLTAEDLLTADEISKVVAAASSPMWKAALAILSETGVRPGELLSIRIKDVVRNGVKYKLKVAGKMEYKQGRRLVYVYQNVALLEAWLQQHPTKDQPDSPLWLVEKGTQLRMIILNKMFKKFCIRANIRVKSKEYEFKGKNVKHRSTTAYPYLLRHGALTNFYRDHGAVIGARLAGHVPGSREIGTYLHLSETDIENALDTANGVKEAIPTPEPLKCPKCSKNNAYGEIFCASCHAALGAAGALVQEDEAQQTAEFMQELKELMQSPLYAEFKKMKQAGNA